MSLLEKKPPVHLADPPRDVPWLLRLANLCGGFMTQFGWAWTGFTMIFVWVFVPNVDLEGAAAFRGRLDTARGTITASGSTNCSENDTRVYEHDYRFTGPDGEEYEGTSYETGGGERAEGESVTIEFPADRPAISRIKGMRRSTFGIEGLAGLAFGAFIALFMALGLGFLIAGIRGGLKANRLLATGKLALGRLKSKEPTNTRINNQMVWKFTFEFEGDDGQTHEASARTHHTTDLEDGAGEYLVYDAFDPSYAALLDNMPGGVAIDEMGQLHPQNPVRALRSLLLPAAVLTVHGLVAYLMLFYS